MIEKKLSGGASAVPMKELCFKNRTIETDLNREVASGSSTILKP